MATDSQTYGDDDTSDGRMPKTLNLNTYKWHAIGDVVPSIRLFGTTDSYSTQIVSAHRLTSVMKGLKPHFFSQPERFHRYPKMHYKRTSKKNVTRQLSRIQARQARIRKLRKQLVPEESEGYDDNVEHSTSYFVGKSENHPVDLPAFIRTKRDDPATTVRPLIQWHSNFSLIDG